MIIDCLGALVVAGAVVGYFYPVPGSFWSNTFFGIPYSVAAIVVPIAAVGCAAAACWFARRTPILASRGAVMRGIFIGVIAFLLFAIFHGIASATVVLLNGEGVSLAVMALVTVPISTAFFGGLFVMPICCIVAVGGEWLAGRIAA